MSRAMRILVLFDLPTNTAADKKEYLAFRKFLLASGYDMLQYSVYCRITRNHDDAKKYMNQLRCHLPSEGQVRALLLTEKQYSQMWILLGTPTLAEKEVRDKELLVL